MNASGALQRYIVEGGEKRNAGPAQIKNGAHSGLPQSGLPPHPPSPPNPLGGGETVIKMMSGEENTDITRACRAFRAKI